MKGMFSPSGTPIRPPTRECTRSALRTAHGGGCDPLHMDPCACFSGPTWHATTRTQKRVFGDAARAPWNSQAQAPGFHLHIYAATPVQKPRGGRRASFPARMPCQQGAGGSLRPKGCETAGLNFGEGRERVGMRGRYSEKMVSKDTVNAALHMGGTATVALRLVLDVQDPEKRTALLSAPLRGAEQGSPLFRTARSVRDFALPPILKRDDLRLDFGRLLRF